jgi:hypothetical protein
VSRTQTQHMPFYLGTFVRLLSSWVHSIYVAASVRGRFALVDGVPRAVVVGRLRPALTDQLIGGVGGRPSHQRDTVE